MTDRVAIEIEVSERHLKLLQEARALRDFCLRHEVALPAALSRLLGEPQAPVNGRPTQSMMTIPPMPSPDPPMDLPPTWIWVNEEDATVVSMVLACLRQAQGPMTPAQIYADLAVRREGLNKGTVANIGTRLDKTGVIRRGDNGWSLVHLDGAPVLHKGRLWGKPSVFEETEVAAYRRHVVRHILRSAPDGLQVMQLTRILNESCSWFNAEIPANKDLVKADVQELEKAKEVRRKGASDKWELTSQ